VTVYITIRRKGLPEVTLQAKDEQLQKALDKGWEAFGDPTKVMSDPTAIFYKHSAQAHKSITQKLPQRKLR
jgi:hypothetical protein